MMLHRRTFIASTLATAALSEHVFAAEQRPFKLFDTHTHFYSNDVAGFPFKASISAPARAKAMAHPMTPEVILRLWDDAGVTRGCGVQYNVTYSTDNRYLLEVAAANPRRISPVVILDPVAADTPGTLARMAKQDRISGVRFAGVPNDAGEFVFLLDAAEGAWAAAGDLGLVIVLMPFQSHQPEAMKRIAVLADRYPKVNIVLDHLGFPRPEASPTFGLSPDHLALASHRNVYYKYTTYLIDQLRKGGVPLKDFLHYAVGIYGADRLCWGSDVGNSEGDYGEFVKLAVDSADGLTLAQKKAIFFDTAERLFIPGGHAQSPSGRHGPVG